MEKTSPLSTAELLLILSHHPTKARYAADGTALPIGVIGALIMDLFAANALSLDNKKRVVPLEPAPHLSSAHQVMYDSIVESSRSRTIKNWISKFNYSSTKWKRLVSKVLVGKGIFRKEDRRFLFIPYTLTWIAEPALRVQLVVKMRKILFEEQEVTPQMQSMLSLARACKLQRIICHDATERKAFKRLAKEAISRDSVTKAIDLAVTREVEATVAAAIVAVSAATVASSG